MGRPTTYKAEYAKQAEKICKLGATNHELAEIFGCSVRAINRWAIEHAAFAKAIQVGKDAADERVVKALYNRAVGYDYEAVKIFCNADGHVTEVPYTEHVPPDVKAAMQWLFNRRPGEWKMRVEHTGKDGGALELVLSSADAKL